MFLARVAVAFLLLTQAVFAQTAGLFTTGQILTATQLNSAFTLKVDYPVVNLNLSGVIIAAGGTQFFGTSGAVNELRMLQTVNYASLYVDGTNVFLSNSGTGDMLFQSLGSGNIFIENKLAQPIISAFNSGALQFNFYTTAGVLKNDAGGNITSQAGLSTTKTVRASGGGSDCTLVFTTGVLTGGSC